MRLDDQIDGRMSGEVREPGKERVEIEIGSALGGEEDDPDAAAVPTTSLDAGLSFGEAFVNWYREEVLRDKKFTDRRWYLGTLLLGDPTLRIRWADAAGGKK